MDSLLKVRWDATCKDYLRAFCRKHNINYDDTYWPGGHIGGTVLLNEEGYAASMDEIRYDIDNEVPVGKFEAFWDYSLRVHTIELAQQELNGGPHDFAMKHVNFEHFCLGAPLYTEEQLSHYENAQAEIREKMAAIEKEIKELQKTGSHE